MRLLSGRLRLATSPLLTGSSPVTNTIGMVVVAVSRSLDRTDVADDHRYLPANESAASPGSRPS